MEIDRRSLLSATSCLAMTKLVGHPRPAGPDEPPWHLLTRLLLDRARRANSARGPVDTTGVERVIQEMARALGCANPPVIKWLANPFDAFAYLSGLGLDELLQVMNAQLWRRTGPAVDMHEDRLNSAAVLGSWIADLVRSAEYDEALMAPKRLSKAWVMAENASAEAVFKVRAVAAQIGWLETCIPVVAAQAVTDVKLLLSSALPRGRYIIS